MGYESQPFRPLGLYCHPCLCVFFRVVLEERHRFPSLSQSDLSVFRKSVIYEVGSICGVFFDTGTVW